MVKNTKLKFQHLKGFTLLEVLLVIALLAILSGISIPVYQSFQFKSDLDLATLDVSQSLRRAQILAQSVDGDMSWGVKTESEKITLFKGASFESRDENLDEIFNIPANVTFSGLKEVVFTKFSGLPEETGTLDIFSNNNQRSVIINQKGILEY